MNKDWTGNKSTTFAQLGASNHSEGEREANDFYATDPNTLEIFLDALKRDGVMLHTKILEPSCGMGHLSEVLKKHGYEVISNDLINRGYGDDFGDFLHRIILDNRDILTNPPYRYAQEFVEHSMQLLQDGYYCIMLLKIQFLEGQARRELFGKYPPKYVYVNSSRQTCYINGDMSKKMSSASCYCWFVWEKGFTGEPTIRWV